MFLATRDALVINGSYPGFFTSSYEKITPFFRSYPYPSSHVMVQWKMNLLLKETFFLGKPFPAYPWLWEGRVCTCMSCPWNQDESASKVPSDFFAPNPSLHQILDPSPISIQKRIHWKEPSPMGSMGLVYFYLLTYLLTWLVHVSNIYLDEWLILMVLVHGGKYTIHGSYGPGKTT